MILSDFKDYYDEQFNEKSKLNYRRFESEQMPRNKALNYLKYIGLPVIDIGPVNNFSFMVDKLVVFKDLTAHHGKGKEIMSLEQARMMYSNMLASQYIKIDGITITLKYLQIGELRFRLIYSNPEESLSMGKLVSAARIEDGRINGISEPIFSIDYVNTPKGLLATDFNQVENLSSLGFDKVMSPEAVAYELDRFMKKQVGR